MKYRELDLNLLMALDRLIELRSVTRAADEMAVTQSAMSNMLARLRVYFDDPLLVQVGRRMEPTARALDLGEPVRDILVRIDATLRSPSTFDPASSTRRFSLMVSDYSLMTVVPALVRRVARLAPGIRLDITPQVMSPDLQLEQGGADVVIAPAMFAARGHPSETLLTDPLVCVLDRANPAAERFDLETLLSREHVIMTPPGEARSYATHLLDQLGLTVEVAIRSFSFASLPALVEGTRRVTVIQSLLADAMAPADRFRVLPPPVALAPLEQRLMWHKLRGPDPGISWLRAQARRAAEALLAGRRGPDADPSPTATWPRHP